MAPGITSRTPLSTTSITVIGEAEDLADRTAREAMRRGARGQPARQGVRAPPAAGSEGRDERDHGRQTRRPRRPAAKGHSSRERLEHPAPITRGETSYSPHECTTAGTSGGELSILKLLAAGELCVCDIEGILGLSQPTVSRHLAYLRRCGLVDVARASRFARYSLRDPASPVQRTLLDCVRSCFSGIPSLGLERSAAEERVEARLRHPC